MTRVTMKVDSVVENKTTGPDTGNLTMTRSGRIVKPPSQVIKEIGGSSIYGDSQRNKCKEA